MTNAALVEAAAALSSECARALRPILRMMVHDLSGGLTPMTLEASALQDLAERLRALDGQPLSAEVAAELRAALFEASTDLQRAVDLLTAYLSEARQAIEEASAQRP
jgi:DNA-binding ferritin-like protein